MVFFCMFLLVKQTKAQKAYVSTNGGEVYKIDISTCSAELIVSSEILFGDIAIDPVTGQLFGTQVNVSVDNGDIYRIDAFSGELTFIGSTGINFTSLVGSPSGMLYGVEGGVNDNLYLIDPNTAAVTIVGSMETGRGSKGDLTFFDEKLYLASNSNHLVEVDLDSLPNSTVLGLFQNMAAVLGISSIGCSEQFFAYNFRDVHLLSPNNLLESTVVCPNIVPNSIYGGASLNQSAFSATKLELPDDTILCDGEVLRLGIGLENDLYTYMWQGNVGDSTYTIDREGTYVATIESDGCTVSDTIEVEYMNCIHECYLYAPTSFTPNEDELNDVFIPKYECIGGALIEDYSLRIYNRWGELLFETDDISQGWDGTSNGNVLPGGIYFYHIAAQQVVADDPEGFVLIDRKDRLSLIR